VREGERARRPRRGWGEDPAATCPPPASPAVRPRCAAKRKGRRRASSLQRRSHSSPPQGSRKHRPPRRPSAVPSRESARSAARSRTRTAHTRRTRPTLQLLAAPPLSGGSASRAVRAWLPITPLPDGRQGFPARLRRKLRTNRPRLRRSPERAVPGRRRRLAGVAARQPAGQGDVVAEPRVVGNPGSKATTRPSSCSRRGDVREDRRSRRRRRRCRPGATPAPAKRPSRARGASARGATAARTSTRRRSAGCAGRSRRARMGRNRRSRRLTGRSGRFACSRRLTRSRGAQCRIEASVGGPPDGRVASPPSGPCPPTPSRYPARRLARARSRKDSVIAPPALAASVSHRWREQPPGPVQAVP